MEIMIVKLIITYLLIATFVLLNLLYNKKIAFYIKNEETGETIPPPSIITVFISLFWIVAFPLLLNVRKKE